MDENHTILWYDDRTVFGMIIHGMITAYHFWYAQCKQ